MPPSPNCWTSPSATPPLPAPITPMATGSPACASATPSCAMRPSADAGCRVSRATLSSGLVLRRSRPMVQIAELDSAPETLEATLSYLARDADKLVTYVAAPGGRDRRIGGDGETHPVVIHNGRLRADRFEFEREGFRFVGSPTRVADFYDDR